MKKISRIDEKMIINEIQTIIDETKINVGKVTIGLKQGGYIGTIRTYTGELRIRIDTWLKASKFQRRCLIIHEMLHYHMNHNIENGYSVFDLLTITVYENIYGKDYHYNECLEKVSKVARRIIER